MSIISKAVCRVIVILSNSNGISYRNTKNNSKNPHVITKRPQILKEIPRRMKNTEQIKISDFKSYYKAKISKEYCAGIKTNT